MVNLPMASPFSWPDRREEVVESSNNEEQDTTTDGDDVDNYDLPPPPPPPRDTMGTGFRFLQQQQTSSSSSSSSSLLLRTSGAKRALAELLQSHQVELLLPTADDADADLADVDNTTTEQQKDNDDGTSTTTKRRIKVEEDEGCCCTSNPTKATMKPQQRSPAPIQYVQEDMTEDEILELSQKNGEISLLASILAVIDRHYNNNNLLLLSSSNTTTAALSSKSIIQKCVLTVSPTRTTGKLDAREMVLAALHFMSSSSEQQKPKQKGGRDSSSGEQDHGGGNSSSRHQHDDLLLLLLPLIRPISITGDLERRSYEKATKPWSIVLDGGENDEFLQKIARLEDVFYDSVSDYRWISRQYYLPHDLLATHQETGPLICHGTLPLMGVPSAAAAAQLTNSGSRGGDGSSSHPARLALPPKNQKKKPQQQSQLQPPTTIMSIGGNKIKTAVAATALSVHPHVPHLHIHGNSQISKNNPVAVEASRILAETKSSSTAAAGEGFYSDLGGGGGDNNPDHYTSFSRS